MKMPQTPPKHVKLPEGALSKENLGLAMEFNSEYLHWDELRRRDTGKAEPAVIWEIMRMLRLGNAQYMKFGETSVSYCNIPEFQRFTHEFDIRSTLNFVSEGKMDSHKKVMYSISSIMEESIASSQMEGANTTIDIAKKMLRDKRSPKNKAERMIYNNYAAMELIKKNKDEKLSIDLILDVHKIITRGTLDDEDDEGVFRRTNDIVVSDPLTGDVYHRPMDFERISDCIGSLCNYVNDESFVPPLIKASVIHYMIAYVHPFTDGNGRLARSLFYWYLIKKGYPLVEFLAISKSIKAHRGSYDLSYLYSETDDNDMTYFIKFNLKCVEESLNTFLKYLGRKMKEQKEFEKNVLANEDMNIRQKMILQDAMKDWNAFSVYEVQSKYQTSYQTARTDILGLMEKGMIKEFGRDGNKKLYMFSGKK
jgi:Uncharacterized conserved protein